MADNVTPSADPTVATDDIAGVHFQRVKLVNGELEDDTAIPGDTGGLFIQEAKGAPTFSSVAVDDTAAVLLIAANADRKSLLLVNDADGRIWLKNDLTAADGVGVPVESGLPFSDDATTSAWYARAATGVTGTVYVVEVQ